MKDIITISKEKFLIYEAVRQSGLTNMLDINTIKVLTGGNLSKEDCSEIMRNYDLYKAKYLDVNNNE